MQEQNIYINGKEIRVNADPDMPLLWVLRDMLDLTGTKYGCGIGQCGACTVHLDGIAVRACLLKISSIAGKQITTIEGIANHPVKEAWAEEDVPQCGYCQVGQIMTAIAFLERKPNPEDDEIDRAMRGNLCRCGTYLRIKKAVRNASSKIQES